MKTKEKVASPFILIGMLLMCSVQIVPCAIGLFLLIFGTVILNLR